MKRKVGTVLDEELLWRAKQAAARERKTLSVLLEEALREHLGRRNASGRKRSRRLVQQTRGALRIDRTLLDTVLKEPGVFEA